MFVMPFQMGQEVVIKVAPLTERFARERDWYQVQNGSGCPRLFGCDGKKGALLIEKADPGSSAKDLVSNGRDREATKAIASAIAELEPRKASNGVFPHVREFKDDLEVLWSNAPLHLLNKSFSLLDSLTSDSTADILLHGDLHHDNVIKHKGQWMAIDPHGYFGPRAFEVGAMIRNPYDCFPSNCPRSETVRDRITDLSKYLPFPRREMLAWSLIYTMVAASWSFQDHGEVPREHIEIGEVLFSQIVVASLRVSLAFDCKHRLHSS